MKAFEVNENAVKMQLWLVSVCYGSDYMCSLILYLDGVIQ